MKGTGPQGVIDVMEAVTRTETWAAEDMVVGMVEEEVAVEEEEEKERGTIERGADLRSEEVLQEGR